MLQPIAMPEQTPQVSDLCQSCGLCCDGTLFGFVSLQPEDALEPLRLAGIPVTTDHAVSRITLGCAAHQHGCCQVYAARPAACRAYFCRVSRRFASGKVTWLDAQTQIARLKRVRDQLDIEIERLRPGTGRVSVDQVSRMIPPFEQLQADAALHRLWAPVLLRLVALRRLANEFNRPRSRS